MAAIFNISLRLVYIYIFKKAIKKQQQKIYEIIFFIISMVFYLLFRNVIYKALGIAPYILTRLLLNYISNIRGLDYYLS